MKNSKYLKTNRHSQKNKKKLNQKQTQTTSWNKTIILDTCQENHKENALPVTKMENIPVKEWCQEWDKRKKITNE